MRTLFHIIFSIMFVSVLLSSARLLSAIDADSSLDGDFTLFYHRNAAQFERMKETQTANTQDCE